MTTKPAYDLCDQCREHMLATSNLANATEEEKAAVLKKAQDHLDAARTQRDYYNEQRTLAQTQQTVEVDGVEHNFNVLSFDFAEQVHIPSSARQVGSAYFRTARKCGAFGIFDERTNTQSNYLINEADSIGKGPDTVLSMLHHYLETHNAPVLVLFADNCVGQNKNNAMLNYLQWRVDIGRNVRIELNFMIPGHTKFSPDRGFGIWKKRYAMADVDCLEDLVVLIETTGGDESVSSRAVATVLDGERNVVWYKWVECLSGSYRKFPGMTSFHQFVFKVGECMKVSSTMSS